MRENRVIYTLFKTDMHDGLSLTEIRGQFKQHVCIEPGVKKHDFPEAVRC